ncbi:MAG: GntR family transcriptional regulator [Bacillota bacterium]|nr:GntR family transcriptional regulator [Bacillota bacterium]
MLKQFRSRPLDEAVEKIEHYIIKNKLSPHTRMPSERDMCDMWDINRTTLRSAIQRLTREGKVYSRRGSGTFVATEKLLCNLQDLKTISDAARRSNRKLSTKVLDTRIIECPKQISKKLCVPLGHKIFVLNRLRLLDNIPVCLETMYLNYERYPTLDKHDFSVESLYHVLGEEFGTKIQRGEQTLSVTYSTEEESAFLKVPIQTPVFFLRGISLDSDDVPFEYFKNISRSDQIRYASVLREHS